LSCFDNCCYGYFLVHLDFYIIVVLIVDVLFVTCSLQNFSFLSSLTTSTPTGIYYAAIGGANIKIPDDIKATVKVKMLTKCAKEDIPLFSGQLEKAGVDTVYLPSKASTRFCGLGCGICFVSSCFFTFCCCYC